MLSQAIPDLPGSGEKGGEAGVLSTQPGRSDRAEKRGGRIVTSLALVDFFSAQLKGKELRGRK